LLPEANFNIIYADKNGTVIVLEEIIVFPCQLFVKAGQLFVKAV